MRFINLLTYIKRSNPGTICMLCLYTGDKSVKLMPCKPGDSMQQWEYEQEYIRSRGHEGRVLGIPGQFLHYITTIITTTITTATSITTVDLVVVACQ